MLAPVNSPDEQPEAPSEEQPRISMRSLGTFVVESGQLGICDPAGEVPGGGDEDGWGFDGLVRNAVNGAWRTFVVMIEDGGLAGECAELIAHHTEHEPVGSDAWQAPIGRIPVDSAQAGVFDRKTVGLDSMVPAGCFRDEAPVVPELLWYSMCCQRVGGEPKAGVVPGGAVASSGSSDGVYEWFAHTNADGAVVAVRVVFVSGLDWR